MMPKKQIRKINSNEHAVVLQIVNDAAEAYREKIPADCWKEPYMPAEELEHEVRSGVQFWGFEEAGELAGVMGIQDVKDVALIRHAYVRTAKRNHGIGGKLLEFLLTQTAKPILVGTWASAVWAIRFYEQHGFRLVTEEEKNVLLRKYWSISDRQVETSVVLADAKWFQKWN